VMHSLVERFALWVVVLVVLFALGIMVVFKNAGGDMRVI
jgi:hypothetical protein